MTIISRLDVASRLTEQVIRNAQKTVDATGVPYERLLLMIEGCVPFNRRVLRYLGIKRLDLYEAKDDLVNTKTDTARLVSSMDGSTTLADGAGCRGVADAA